MSKNNCKVINSCWLTMCFILCSCDLESERNIESDVFPYNGFKKEVSLSGNRVFEDAIGTLSIDIIDTIFLFYAPESNDGVFELYGKNSKRYIGKFGPTGRGPGEFLLPIYAGQYSLEPEGLKIWINDRRLDRLSHLNLNSKNLNSGNIELAAIPIDAENAFFLNENKTIGTHASIDGRSYLTNPQTQDWLEYKTHLFPGLTITEELYNNPEQLYWAYFEYCRMKPDKSRYACGMLTINLNRYF